ncbi:glycosyltransferase family 4 protein [Ruegeria marisrubri]|nr:glycosyltransferase family 4 protein [Ruegeria marisrubri]
MQNSQSEVRVLALAAEAFGASGGIAQSTRDLMLALSNMPEVDGVDILPRLQPDPATKLPAGIRQFSACKSRLAYAIRAIWLAATLRPQVVYCGHAFMAPLAYLCARLAGAYLVSHVHGLEVWQPLTAIKRRALAASDLILCVSRYTEKKVIEVTGADPSRCKVIFNTYDERFTPGDKIAAREKFKIPREATVLSTVSRLDPQQRHKGHDRVIPLLKNLTQDYPNLVYLIAGKGGDRARLEELARNSGSGDIVRFLGFVADDDLPDLYRASDIYTMPSHGEGFGIAFVEAMACGTLALGLNVGGAGDALRDGELGLAVTEENFPDTLRVALARLPVDHTDLSERTRAAFGRPRFAARVEEAVAPLFS